MLLFNKFSYFVLDTANYCVILYKTSFNIYAAVILLVLCIYILFIIIIFIYIFCMYVCVYIYMYAYTGAGHIIRISSKSRFISLIPFKK